MRHELFADCENVRILPMNKEHSQVYRVIRNKYRTCFFYPKTISRQQQEKWYDNYINNPKEIMFSIIAKWNNECIGGCGLYNFNYNCESCEFGRIVLEYDHNIVNGLGKEAVAAVVDLAFIELGIKHVFLEVFANNMPAIKTYEKAGFVCCEKRLNIVTMYRDNLS